MRPGIYLLLAVCWSTAAGLTQAMVDERPGLAKPIEPAAQSGSPAQTSTRLLPEHPAYRALHQALGRYLSIREHDGWPPLQSQGLLLKSGDEGDEVSRIRRQLSLLGDLPESASAGQQFDAALERAVRRFQHRHGLDEDGIVGRKTRTALAVPVDQRVQQLRINLERWHRLPRDLGERYIMVNSAAFQLQVHEGERVPLEMRVIVGRKARQTPSFSKPMRYLIVNPYWHVPNRIARVDLIPALLRDPDYFSDRHIRVFSSWQQDAVELDPLAVHWSDYTGKRSLPFQLRQDPGPGNALGRIKFMLPNRYSVYLHDTPSKQLFERPVRMFSSGCIRVEKPLELANYVLNGGADGQPLPDLEAIIRQRKTRTIPLPRPIPVYMVYLTTWVDRNGEVHFHDDIYRRDRRRAALMPPEPTASVAVTNAGKTSIARTLEQQNPE